MPKIFSEHQIYLPKHAGTPMHRNFIRGLTLKYRIEEILYTEVKKFFPSIFSIRDEIENKNLPIPSIWKALFQEIRRDGFLETIQAREQFNDSIKLSEYAFYGRTDKEKTDGQNIRVFALGAEIDPGIALSKGLGEYLERYTLSQYKKNTLAVSSASDLIEKGEVFLDPKNIARIGDSYKNNVFKTLWDEHTKMNWVQTRSLTDNKQTLVPAQLIFWNYKIDQSIQEPLIRESNTNGSAGGFTKAEAALSGIYELFERHNFLWFWLQKKVPPRIDLTKTTSPRIKNLVEKLCRYNLEAVIIDTSTAFSKTPIHSYQSILIDKSGHGPRIAVGGGAHHDSENAVYTALIESITVHHQLRHMRNKWKNFPKYSGEMRESVGHFERQFIWANESMFEHIEKFISGETIKLEANERETGISPKTALDNILKLLGEKGDGYTPYQFEANHPTLRKLGYHVVKIIIPNLIPLNLYEESRPRYIPNIKLPKKENFPHPIP